MEPNRNAYSAVKEHFGSRRESWRNFSPFTGWQIVERASTVRPFNISATCTFRLDFTRTRLINHAAAHGGSSGVKTLNYEALFGTAEAVP